MVFVTYSKIKQYGMRIIAQILLFEKRKYASSLFFSTSIGFAKTKMVVKITINMGVAEAATCMGLHYSVGSYIKLSGIHGGWCWFDMNISIGTHQIFINLISVQRGGIYLSDDVKKLQKFGI